MASERASNKGVGIGSARSGSTASSVTSDARCASSQALSLVSDGRPHWTPW